MIWRVQGGAKVFGQWVQLIIQLLLASFIRFRYFLQTLRLFATLRLLERYEYVCILQFLGKKSRNEVVKC